MLGGWGFRFVKIKGLAPFGAKIMGKKKENFDESSKIFFP